MAEHPAQFPPGTEHYTNQLGLHVMQSGAGPQGIRDSGVVLGNIHQLYQSNTSGRRNLAVLMNAEEKIRLARPSPPRATGARSAGQEGDRCWTSS